MHLLFRLKYLHDIILRPTIEDTGVSALNSMIAYTTTDICTRLFEDSSSGLVYLARVLKLIYPGVDVSDILGPSNCRVGNDSSSSNITVSSSIVYVLIILIDVCLPLTLLAFHQSLIIFPVDRE